jgi:hypothetical protein
MVSGAVTGTAAELDEWDEMGWVDRVDDETASLTGKTAGERRGRESRGGAREQRVRRGSRIELRE